VKGTLRAKFERLMLPHLAASHNLARWLLQNSGDAEDAVQEAYLRAFRAFDRYRGGDSAAWLLKIVRNVCITRLRNLSSSRNVVPLETALQRAETTPLKPLHHTEELPPDEAMIVENEREAVRRALLLLPVDYREVVILREFEDLSYKQIALVTNLPIGTVMSRLSRARTRLRALLSSDEGGGQQNEM